MPCFEIKGEDLILKQSMLEAVKYDKVPAKIV